MLSRQVRAPVFRVEVSSKFLHREKSLLTQIQNMGIKSKACPKIIDLYFITGKLALEEVQTIAATLISDPITDSCQVIHQEIERSECTNSGHIVEVALRPGVTDNIAQQLIGAASRLNIVGIQAISTGQRYELPIDLSPAEIQSIAAYLLANDTIQRFAIGEVKPEFVDDTPHITKPESLPIRSAHKNELQQINQDRRLALNPDELSAIQAYFQNIGREPTDAELETTAQTWSEHCIHKTFNATINLPDGSRVKSIIHSYLKAATDTINAPWVRSAFVDNAGVIAFDDDYDLSFKVETHNHPSAIEPFGGANTGVGGVVRDVLGVSHRPIANTNVLCFGPLSIPYDELPPGVLHPLQIQEGVVAGVGDYGNKLGIPTVNGTVIYHPGYLANPLVYCGCVGIGPRDSHPRKPHPGDHVIVLGGRTGRDGLRGATFSSLTMDAQTGQVAGASVQIGDPITEKGLLEVVVLARDKKLYTAITDCGAGGLSSAVGEMGRDLGAAVDLSKVTTKYQGLAPWEIWLSEAQERMVLAVPPENIPALQNICADYWVEISDIGVFNSSKRLLVTMANHRVVDLEMEFLHHGIPPLTLSAKTPPKGTHPSRQKEKNQSCVNYNDLLLSLLAHPDIASKENIIRRYDHEVRGGTLVKPLTGVNMDGPSDAAVIKPLETLGKLGFALANGINPRIGEHDAYQMAISVVDEAIRNCVCVGGDPDKLALLDNFCWGDPSRPETLGGLVEAARGCHDAAVLFNTPFISGKDSLNNEYVGNDGRRHAIPGTLLISSIAIVPDVDKIVTMDFKNVGDQLYLIGDWQPTLLGSQILSILSEDKIKANFGDLPSLSSVPMVSPDAPEVYRGLHQAIQQGLIQSAHDLSEGGMAVAAAEMSLAARMGAAIRLDKMSDNPGEACFGESNNCIIVALIPKNCPAFEELFHNLPILLVGEVIPGNDLTFFFHDEEIVSIEVEELAHAFTRKNGIHRESE